MGAAKKTRICPYSAWVEILERRLNISKQNVWIEVVFCVVGEVLILVAQADLDLSCTEGYTVVV